jgi:methyltransferase (TIGR00027 family)
MAPQAQAEADPTAVRTALWRALHVELDAPPHVFEDTLGLALANPEAGWRDRGDMHPEGTRPFRASIVGRARLVEDLVAAEAARGVGQYVLLGAGLDTFAERRPELASKLRVFEVDRPGPGAWKQQRLRELGYGVPAWLRFVPVDFEGGASWREGLEAAGFARSEPAIVASTGVSMYLTREANQETLREAAKLAPGSVLALTFLQPLERAEPSARAGLERSAAGARASGTPFISFFEPAELAAMARSAGFREVEHVSAKAVAERYFAGRADGLRPPERGEEFLLART